VAGQRRLAFSRLRVPNLDGAVAIAAGNLLSIGAPRHRVDPVIVIVRTRIKRKKGKKNTKKFTNPSARSKKNLHLRVPGQRRLAISRLQVPNLDGFVITAAGNLLSIGAPRHWTDTEIARSHHTNQYNHRKNWKNLQFWMPYQCRSPSTRKTYVFESFTFLFCKDILISKKLPFQVVLHTGHSDRNMINLVNFRAYWLKTIYMLECPVTGHSGG